jgi:prepilin-type processing-associated H-X9-DG protein
VKESTLRKAISDGRIGGPNRSGHRSSSMHDLGTTKSERSRLAAQAAEGLGTACTRANERVEAAMGVVQNACGRFETCRDVRFGGVLAGLPALCGNGLFSGLGKHLSLPAGFYSAMHILTLLGFMALARIRRPEGLRHIPPGKLGKVIGLDRAPEVRTLREKISIMGKTGTVREWMKELSAVWMDADPTEAGYLYVDGHVRVYHGDRAVLPTRFVSREKLCLRGTTDYWVNDALGRPFFVVSKTVTEGLSSVLLNEIVSDLLETVPQQPSQAELDADPLLHRFIIVFDREGSSHDLLSKL